MSEQAFLGDSSSREHLSRARKPPKNLLAELNEEASKKRVNKQPDTPQATQTTNNPSTRKSSDITAASKASRDSASNLDDTAGSVQDAQKETETMTSSTSARKNAAKKSQKSKKKGKKGRKTSTTHGLNAQASSETPEESSSTSNAPTTPNPPLTTNAGQDLRAVFKAQVAPSGFAAMSLEEIPDEHRERYPMMTFLTTHPSLMDLFSEYRREFINMTARIPATATGGAPATTSTGPASTTTKAPATTATKPAANKSKKSRAKAKKKTPASTATQPATQNSGHSTLANEHPELAAFEYQMINDIEGHAQFWWSDVRRNWKEVLEEDPLWMDTPQGPRLRPIADSEVGNGVELADDDALEEEDDDEEDASVYEDSHGEGGEETEDGDED